MLAKLVFFIDIHKFIYIFCKKIIQKHKSLYWYLCSYLCDGISKEDFNVFELQSALIAGDMVKANRITQYFASSKDHPMIKELGILYGFFANLMIYHYLPDKSERVAGPAMGVAPYFVKDYAAAARRFSAGKTFAIIGYFREIDARLKGINNPSAKDADLWKELIYKILH